jgi:hypothetical protein
VLDVIDGAAGPAVTRGDLADGDPEAFADVGGARGGGAGAAPHEDPDLLGLDRRPGHPEGLRARRAPRWEVLPATASAGWMASAPVQYWTRKLVAYGAAQVIRTVSTGSAGGSVIMIH